MNIKDKAYTLTAKLEHELNLTADQKGKVYTILLERSKQWQKEVNTANASNRKVQVDRINNKAYQELKLILTEEQLQKYKDLRQDLSKQKAQYRILSNQANVEDQEFDF